jgi:hypothetical protein
VRSVPISPPRTLALLALAWSTLAQAGDQPTNHLLVPASISPTSVVKGSDTLVTWTLREEMPSGKLTEALLTQSQVDAMTFSWSLVADPDHPERFGGRSTSGHARTIRSQDDVFLTYPVEVILPGWRLLDGVQPALPGKYRVWWSIGPAVRTTEVLWTVDEQPAGSAPLPPGQELPYVCIPYGLDVASAPATAIAPDGELLAKVTRMPPEYDHPAVWRSAVIEWTRLPTSPGGVTTVFSPIQTGRVRPETLAAGPGDGVPHPRDLRFQVSRDLRDPRTDSVVPGTYRVRVAMTWAVQETSVDDPGRTTLRQYSIRSQPWTVRVLKDGEPVPAPCPVCGAIPDR